MKFLIFILSVSLAHAQVDFPASAGGVAPNVNRPIRRTQADVSYLKFQPGECAFEPQLSADDQSLLSNALTAVKSLRENDKCKAIQPQLDAFQSAMATYNQQSGVDRAPGYDGMINVNCINFERVYDLEFEFFTSNWNGAPGATNDPFLDCRNQTDREVAISCAAKVTASSKGVKRHQCEIQKSAIKDTVNQKVVNDSYAAGLQALQSIINSGDCIDSTGDQKLSFIQSAVGLSGRAATIGAAGGPAGMLLGAATSVIGSVFSKLFSGGKRNTDSLAILENRENFTKLSCLYEKLENKALRCDRIEASRNVEDTKKTYEEAQNCVESSHAEVVEANELIKNVNNLIQGMLPAPEESTAPPRAAGAFNQRVFDGLVDKFNSEFPGTNETFLTVATRSAEDNIREIDRLVSSDENLRGYLSSKNHKSISGSELRRLKSSLLEDKQKAEAVLHVFQSIQTADEKGTQMSDSDVQTVAGALKEFSGGPVSFMGAFNEVMLSRVDLLPDDNFSGKVEAYNLRLDEARAYQELINKYQSDKNQSQASFDDGGRFREARNGLRSHLKLLLDQELDTLMKRGDSLKNLAPGAPSTAIRETLQTKEEEIIYPILRACNQLRSVMALGRRGSDTTSQHEACEQFNCEKGTKTFNDFLKENSSSVEDSDKCDTPACEAQYSRYICQERKELPKLRDNIKNEFLSKGTICGKAMSQVFR